MRKSKFVRSVVRSCHYSNSRDFRSRAVSQRFHPRIAARGGCFSVSVKLIIMASKNTKTASRVEQHLKRIEELLERKDSGDAN